MTEDGLDRLVVHAETVEVRREAAAKGMPPVPLLAVSREDRRDVALGEGVEIEGLAIPRTLEDEAFGWIPALSSEFRENLLQRRNDRAPTRGCGESSSAGRGCPTRNARRGSRRIGRLKPARNPPTSDRGSRSAADQ